MAAHIPHTGAPVRTCRMSLYPKPNGPSRFGKLFIVDCLLIFSGWFLAKILVSGTFDPSKYRILEILMVDAIVLIIRYRLVCSESDNSQN